MAMKSGINQMPKPITNHLLGARREFLANHPLGRSAYLLLNRQDQRRVMPVPLVTKAEG